MSIIIMHTLTDLVMRCFSDVEQLASQWEHSIVVPAHHPQPTDSQCLGRVSLREDESAVVRVPASCLVGIVQLWNALGTANTQTSAYMACNGTHIHVTLCIIILM